MSATLDKQYPDSEACQCDECKECCVRPCWPTPSEAQALIDAGFGSDLMLDEWCGDSELEDTKILCPAGNGCAKQAAPFDPRVGCSMLDSSGLCRLHDLGLKPKEGRAAHHASDAEGLHLAVARSWDTDEGLEIVAAWCKTHGVDSGEGYETGEILSGMFSLMGCRS